MPISTQIDLGHVLIHNFELYFGTCDYERNKKIFLWLLQESDGCLTLVNKYLLVLFKNNYCIQAKFRHFGIF